MITDWLRKFATISDSICYFENVENEAMIRLTSTFRYRELFSRLLVCFIPDMVFSFSVFRNSR